MTSLNGTMVPIETVEVGSGGAAEIEFTNIPQTYTDLQILYSARTSGSTGYSVNLRMTFNNSTSRYYERLLYNAGGGVGSVSKNNTDPYLNWSALAQDALTGANIYGSGQFYITNYTSNVGKSISSEYVSEDNNTSPWIMMNAALWDPVSNAPITSIKLVPSAGSFVQHSTATLYGIQSIGTAAKATGGMITSDENYYYHTFLSSGTFTPKQSISADILVIAGGGGGGGRVGGGGGAGGFQAFTSQSFSTINYTVTVGAGGNASSGTGTATNGSNSQFGSLTASTGGGGGASLGSGVGATGGSGGGGAYGQNGGGNVSGQGNIGGAGLSSPTSAPGGGGGGATSAGGNGTGTSNSDTVGGTGGTGTNAYSAWANATSTGANGFYAGGGGGGISANDRPSAKGIGGSGGGGNGSNNQASAGIAGTANTGGGGGGGADISAGGNGGSGIVIIRYAK